MHKTHPKALEESLPSIPVIEKLKRLKGTSFLRKLIKLGEFIIFEEDTRLEIRQTFLFLMIEGRGTIKLLRNKVYFEKEISPNDYYLTNKAVFEVIICKGSFIMTLEEKYLIGIFEGIISFPFLE